MGDLEETVDSWQKVAMLESPVFPYLVLIISQLYQTASKRGFLFQHQRI